MKIKKHIDTKSEGLATTKSAHYPIKNAYLQPIENIIDNLKTNQQYGLSEIDIDKRIKTYGLNKYEEQKQKSIFLLVVEQFKSPIILLLVLGAGVSFLFQHWLEGGSIIVVKFFGL